VAGSVRLPPASVRRFRARRSTARGTHRHAGAGTLYSRGWPVDGGIADLPDLFESMQVAAESADENVR
jgi:hypothetical protein